MNKNIKLLLLAAVCLLTAMTATAQRELHLYTHHYDYETQSCDSAFVWESFDASRIDSIKIVDHIDVAPEWAKAEVDGYRVRITWSAVDNVPRYYVYRSTDGETWISVAYTGGDCEAYDTDPMFGTNYYKVCAAGISYVGPFSAVTSVEVAPEVYAYNTFFEPMTELGYDHDDFGLMSKFLALDVRSEDIAFGAFHFFGYDYNLEYREAPYVRTAQYWRFFYNLIDKANIVINLLENNPATAGEKCLLAQAYALRGMAYMYLVQVYSDYMTVGETEGELTPINREAKGVPIIYTPYDGKTDDEIDAARGRNTVGDVLDEAERNLTQAATLLQGTARQSKEFIDYSVAQGLLARYYLLTQQWQKAADAANAARQGYSLRTATELTDGFMDLTTSDVMWGFDHTADTQTKYASFFSHMSNDAPGYAGMGYCPKLIDARLYGQIPDGDSRKQLFNSSNGDRSASQSGARRSYAARKFGFIDDWTMDYIYMRAAEMVLIEAEAYARLGQNEKGVEVLKSLMDPYYADGWNETSVSVEDVLLQRRIELWGEGFAYFDLKRNNKGIDRAYDGTNHLNGYQLQVPAHDVRWTYQIPNFAFNNSSYDLDPETDQNP